MSDLTFTTNNGFLTWGAEHYKSISGPFGEGVLPLGEYTIAIYNAVEGKGLKPAYQDSATDDRWFLPLKPQFSTHRDGFGIHPDGNKPGTLGCIGIQASDAGSFWRRWNNTPMTARPTNLTVRK